MSTCTNCIWEEFSEPLKSFIKKRVANEQDADDILQEVFLKIHSNIGSLIDDNKIHAWIYRITRNTITDYYRRKGNNIEITELSKASKSGVDEELSINTETVYCLKGMIDSLPEMYKQSILLTEFQNMTQKELSEAMGISISGAKSRVQRARKMIKKMLLGCCYFEFDRFGNIIDYKHKNSKKKNLLINWT